ncbi:MAG: hypothetical protein EU539_05915 [Promethearchaeota archaeon]|nr:MAG: hypothetical protein EU539_05915 [Candidatus Lokiarchaeota archaeon]
MSEYDLKGKMGKWGPFEEKESKWVLFTVGNPYEGHGLALPRNIDDLHAKKAANVLEFTTGQRYVAHIPYTTDRCGDVAKEWSPYYIPWDEFYQKSISFMKYFIKLIRGRGEEVSRVMLITGHGGNGGLLERKCQKLIRSELDVSRFIAVTALVTRKEAGLVIEEVKKLAKEYMKINGAQYGCNTAEELADFFTKILLSAGHASHTEYSLAAALGVCDMEKVAFMNRALEKDFEDALKKWPPIGGLGGYLLAGGKYTEALGTKENDKFGLWNCLNGLKTLNDGKLIVIPELGELIYRLSVETKTELINKYL